MCINHNRSWLSHGNVNLKCLFRTHVGCTVLHLLYNAHSKHCFTVLPMLISNDSEINLSIAGSLARLVGLTALSTQMRSYRAFEICFKLRFKYNWTCIYSHPTRHKISHSENTLPNQFLACTEEVWHNMNNKADQFAVSPC